MFHFHSKTIRRIVTAIALGLFLFALTAWSGSTPNASAAYTPSDAFINAQQTASQQTTSSILTLTVNPYPTPFTVYEVGQTMNYTVATGTDALGPGDPLTTTINWGDNTTPTQQTFIDGRSFEVTGSHAYSKLGKYTITVTAAITVFQQSTSGTGTVTVVPAYTLTAKNSNVKYNHAFNTVVAKGTDPFPNDPLTGTIDWGDNTTPTNVQVTSSAQGNFQVKGTHTYSQVSSFTITISLTSDIVGPIQATGTATVTPLFTLTAKTITAHAGHAFNGNVATITGTLSNVGTRVNIEWGDGMVSKVILGGATGTINVFSGHVYSQAGTYTIIIIMKDNGTGEQAHAYGSAIVQP